jgi:DUF1680 family protein
MTWGRGIAFSRRHLLGLIGAGILATPKRGATAGARLLSLQTMPTSTGEGRGWAKSPVVPNKIKDVIQPLEYSQEKLNPDSLLGRRLDIAVERGLLGAIDLDSYLRPYREGVQPRWPAGEFLGKFMQAFSRMYLYSGNPEFLDRMQIVSKAWVAAQQSDGWLGTGPRFGAWDVWEHKYTIIGLIEQYALVGDQSALNAAGKIGSRLIGDFGPGGRDLMRTGSWGLGSCSVLEAMVSLYRFTCDERYLKFCLQVIEELDANTGPKLIEILAHGSGSVYDVVDPTNRWHNGRKGYEMISCLIGLLRMHQLTGNGDYLLAAERASRDIAENRLFITGSTTNSETFRPDHVLPAESVDDVGEGCVSAHWLYMNQILLQITGNPRYADEIERTLYNHLLASNRPTDAHQAYFTPLNGTRPFELQDIWTGKPPCCFSSVLRCIARMPESAWGTFGDDGLVILMYNRGTAAVRVSTKEGPRLVNFDVDTSYPRDGNVKIQINPDKPVEFPIRLRVPNWTKRFVVLAEGQSWNGTPGEFLVIERRWKAGDSLSVSIDLNDRLVSGAPSYDGFFAFEHGPQVLAVDSWHTRAALGELKIDPNRPASITEATSVLPFGWVGDQAYTSENIVAESTVLLVPFSDVGQQGISQTYRTWIKA